MRPPLLGADNRPFYELHPATMATMGPQPAIVWRLRYRLILTKASFALDVLRLGVREPESIFWSVSGPCDVPPPSLTIHKDIVNTKRNPKP